MAEGIQFSAHYLDQALDDAERKLDRQALHNLIRHLREQIGTLRVLAAEVEHLRSQPPRVEPAQPVTKFSSCEDNSGRCTLCGNPRGNCAACGKPIEFGGQHRSPERHLHHECFAAATAPPEPEGAGEVSEHLNQALRRIAEKYGEGIAGTFSKFIDEAFRAGRASRDGEIAELRRERDEQGKNACDLFDALKAEQRRAFELEAKASAWERLTLVAKSISEEVAQGDKEGFGHNVSPMERAVAEAFNAIPAEHRPGKP